MASGVSASVRASEDPGHWALSSKAVCALFPEARYGFIRLYTFNFK